jgi:probable HAF family extracellular repeat protein
MTNRNPLRRRARLIVAIVAGLVATADWRTAASDRILFLTLPVGALATTVGANAFTVAGNYQRIGAFLWMPTSADTRVGGTSAAVISRDGHTLIGNALDARGFENAAVWTAANDWQLLGSIREGALPCDRLLSAAFGGTDDGKVVVGLAWDGCSKARAFRWEASTGVVDLGSANGLSTRANGISNDRKVVVGWRTHPTGFRQAAKWVNGREELIEGPYELLGEAHAVNSNSTIIVGGGCDPSAVVVSSPAWVWRSDTGVTCYPVVHPSWLPRSVPYRPIMFDLTDNGRIIVGAYTFGLDSEALLWIDGRVHFLKEYLEQRGLPDAFRRWVNTGFLLGVSPDGRTLVGYGAGPTGFQGYIVVLPEGPL